MQMKLFCALIFLSLVSISAITRPVDMNKSFSVQNNFFNSFSSNDRFIKKNNIRLFPNPSTDGTVTVHSIINEPLNFYVFDVEGTLLHRIFLKGKEHRKITGLKKGTYMYDVFKKDESIEQGKITIK